MLAAAPIDLLSAPMPPSPGLVCQGLGATATSPAGESVGSVAIGVIATGAVIAALVGIGALYNQWAYGDWTCLLKSCTQTSIKR